MNEILSLNERQMQREMERDAVRVIYAVAAAKCAGRLKETDSNLPINLIPNHSTTEYTALSCSLNPVSLYKTTDKKN